MSIQEEIDNKTIALVISTTKLTGRLLQAAIREYQRQRQNHKNNKQVKGYQGKQTIKQLVKSGAALSNIEITDQNIKSFESVAKKYGVDYAITKDQNVMPPKYTVFFKAKDADALTYAFEEFTNRKLKAKEKPSVLEQLNKLKELVAAILPDKVRHKSQERDL